MLAKTYCLGVLAMGASGFTAAQPPAAADSVGDIKPFSAHYVAEWKNISVGSSDLELKHDAQAGRYVYKWTITARGIFRLVYSNDVTQESWFSTNADHVRPEKYRAQEGSSSVNLDFDWDGGYARGSSEDKPVELKLKSGTQDLMSIQIEVMLDLKNGNLPKIFHIIDKDEIKDFEYSQEGTASLKTALGQLDTVIVASRHSGSDRILRMWFAPSLGFLPVQAERSRDGKLEFAMRIRSLKP
jgi:hypothetical protein